MDPDSPNTPVMLSTGGDDGGAFSINRNGVLTLTADPTLGEPDYEDPGDANEDNLYELTVIATDGTGMTSSLAVTVKVTNDPTDDNVNTPAT